MSRSFFRLDKLDFKILDILSKNSNHTNEFVQKQIGLSSKPYGERIKKLEKYNVIRGYHADVDQKFLGYTSFYLLVTLVDQKAESLDTFFKDLSLETNVQEISTTTGLYDFLIKLRSATEEEKNSLIQQISKRPDIVKIQYLGILREEKKGY